MPSLHHYVHHCGTPQYQYSKGPAITTASGEAAWLPMKAFHHGSREQMGTGRVLPLERPERRWGSGRALGPDEVDCSSTGIGYIQISIFGLT